MSTTVASANGRVRSCRCAAAETPTPGPVTRTSSGAGLPSSVTIVTSGAADQACAATRSAGTPPSPTRGSSRVTRSTVTPSPAPVISTTAVPSNGAEPSCSPRSRRSGVNRQFSSRPPGTSNASTS